MCEYLDGHDYSIINRDNYETPKFNGMLIHALEIVAMIEDLSSTNKVQIAITVVSF